MACNRLFDLRCVWTKVWRAKKTGVTEFGADEGVYGLLSAVVYIPGALAIDLQ